MPYSLASLTLRRSWAGNIWQTTCSQGLGRPWTKGIPQGPSCCSIRGVATWHGRLQSTLGATGGGDSRHLRTPVTRNGGFPGRIRWVFRPLRPRACSPAIILSPHCLMSHYVDRRRHVPQTRGGSTADLADAKRHAVKLHALQVQAVRVEC